MDVRVSKGSLNLVNLEKASNKCKFVIYICRTILERGQFKGGDRLNCSKSSKGGGFERKNESRIDKNSFLFSILGNVLKITVVASETKK